MFGLDKLTDLFKGLFPIFYHWIVAPFMEFRTFRELIFGKNGDENLVYGIFTVEEIENIYIPGMNIFVALAVFAILIAIIIAGMRIASVGINPSNRTYVFEFLKDLVIVALVFFNLYTLYSVIFTINYAIVGMFGATNPNPMMEMFTTIEPGDDVLGMIIIGLCLLGLSIWANFYYLMRKLTLLIFMILGPLMVAFYLIPQTKPITMGWLKEFVGTVFVQSIHACLYWIVALLAITSTGIESVILYIIFIPTAEAIRGLFGLGGGMHNNLAKAGALFGMSALAGVYGSVKGALSDKSVMGAVQGAYKGAKDAKDGSGGDGTDADAKKTIAGNTGTDTGTTSRAEKMLKAGQITSKMGKAVFGAAGAIAGSTMGPVGSMAGSTIGFIGGGVVGGVTGRVGTAGAMLVGNGIKNGFKKGIKDGSDTLNAESLADEKLANTIADSATNKWAAENKEDFYKKTKEKFPDAHENSIDSMWDKEVSKKRSEFQQQAKDTIGSIKKNDGTYANANDLAKSTAENLTKNWANDNKQQFMDEFDKQNPITPDMSEGDMIARNKKKEEAWNKALDNKRQQYSQIANNAASTMSHAVSESQAREMAENWAKDNKQQFMDDYDKKHPPHQSLSKEELAKRNQAKEQAWSQALENKRNEFSGVSPEQLTQNWAKDNKQKFMDDYDKKNPVTQNMSEGEHQARTQAKEKAWSQAVDSKRKEFSSQSAEQLTQNWANENKKQFMEEFDKNNPITKPLTEAQIQERNQAKEQAWSQAVDSKRKQFIQTGGNPQHAYIKKGDFAKTVGEQAYLADKQDFANNYRVTNPNASQQEIDVEFQKQHGGKKTYVEQARQAGGNVNAKSLYTKDDVNTDYLATQLANMKTEQQKKLFIDANKDMPGGEKAATLKWEQQSAGVYNQNLKEIAQSMPQHIPLDKTIISNKGLRVAGAVATGVGSGVLNAVGVPQIANFVKDTKIGKAISAGAMGATIGFQDSITTISTEGTPLLKTGAVISNTVKEAVNQVGVSLKTPHIAENVIQKQRDVVAGAAFATGVIGGVGAYQKTASVVTKFNPYNKQVNSQIAEVSDIEHLAQTVDDGSGNKQIAKGAVQLVTTGNQSYIQVRDKTGKTNIVSRYGSGDSSLKSGEVVYQDLDVQDGALIHNSPAYKVDSAGGKINLNRKINVNPTSLLANHNTKKNPYIVEDVQALNQQVDSGQYNTNDVIRNTQDVRMVVTKKRSYMVAREPESGQEYRVSPYSTGDARLDENEVRTINYSVKNRRLVKDGTFDQDNKTVTYHTSIDVEDLMPTPRNKRSTRRKEFENIRHKGYGGTV
ncbi:hypothetical protein [Bacillus alkalicellulosilyticus]|uniref:hypothetical protein n=1 Tax=Alkalihalobacterium alkalicellulosilyticum TaxID=1912214 RepID=UPI0009962541|nr:hypothetical protein [Bacillus alkalicellulosilyticus]